MKEESSDFLSAPGEGPSRALSWGRGGMFAALLLAVGVGALGLNHYRDRLQAKERGLAKPVDVLRTIATSQNLFRARPDENGRHRFAESVWVQLT